MEYQQQHQYFGIWQAQATMENAMRLNRKCEIQDGGQKTGSDNITACRQVRNEISTATPMFQGSNIHMLLTKILQD